MRSIVMLALAAALATNAAAQRAPRNASLDPEHVVITEPVRGSDIPVQLMYVETLDGLYTPIGLRTPRGDGPFPVILFASGNGGGGMAYVRDVSQNQSWTQDEFLKAGYAVAWLRYRTEVELGYNKGGQLIRSGRQGRELFNRSPLEYEDVISVIEYLKTLPFIDPERVGYMGMSHGGEMAFKITSEYHGLRAAIASEPANHEFLSLTPDDTAFVEPETGMRNIESMLMRETEKVRGRIDLPLARQRIGSIRTPIFVQGRNSDELQGIFRVSYDLLVEAGKETQWRTYEHDEHGFVYVKRDERGRYAPDPVQQEAVRDSIAWFDRYMKGQGAGRTTGGGSEYTQPFYND